MLFLAIVMVLILVVATLVIGYVAYPHTERRFGPFDRLLAPMRRLVAALPTLEVPADREDEQEGSSVPR